MHALVTTPVTCTTITLCRKYAHIALADNGWSRQAHLAADLKTIQDVVMEDMRRAADYQQQLNSETESEGGEEIDTMLKNDSEKGVWRRK